MKMTIFIPSLEYGVRYWASLVSALEQTGMKIVVLTGVPPKTSPGLSVVAVGGKRLRRRQSEGYDTIVTLISPGLIWKLWSIRPSVSIVVEYSLGTVWAIVAAKTMHSKILIFQENRRRRSRLQTVFHRMLLRFVGGVIANTESASNDLVTELGVDRYKVFEVPLLVPPSRQEMVSAENRLVPAKKRPAFLFVGDLIPRKNVVLLIHASHRLLKKGHEFSVCIVGDGPLRSELHDLVASLGLSEAVRFAGSVTYDSIGHAYDDCDVFVMPTLDDYRSVSVLEAIRFGKPVITSVADGNANDTVQHGWNGFVISPRSAQQLSNFMEAFILKPELIAEMGKHSKALLETLTPEYAASALAALVRQLAQTDSVCRRGNL